MHVNGTIDIIHTSTTGVGFGNSATEVKRYQTFVCPSYATGIVTINVKLRRMAGNPSGMPKAQLYATTLDGKPYGRALAVGTLTAVGTSFEDSWGQLAVYGLVPGKEFAVVLSTQRFSKPLSSNRFEWAVAPVGFNLHFGKWDGKEWIDESSQGNGWLQIGVSEGDSSVDLTHNGEDGNAFGQTIDQIKRFQTFLITDCNPIVGLDVKVRKIQGASQSDILVELYSTEKVHCPKGNVLASAVISAEVVGSDWTVVNAPLHYAYVTGYKEFAVVLSQMTPGPCLYEWAVSGVNKAASFGKWDGTSWIDESDLGDGWLKLWVMPWTSSVTTLNIDPMQVNGFGFGNVSDEIKRYQTFGVWDRRTIIGVDIQVRKFNSPGQGDITAELYATSQTRPFRPVGSPLAKAIWPASQVSNDWSLIHIPLKSQPLADGPYAIVLGQDVPGGPHYEWAVGAIAVTNNYSCNNFGKWNGTEWKDESGQGNGWSRIWTTTADSLIDLSHSAIKGIGFGNLSDGIKRYQIFKVPPYTHYVNLNGIQIKLRKLNGESLSDVIVELYETTQNKPSGFPKCSAIIPSTLIKTEWTTLSVPLYYATDFYGRSITPGKQYAIVLSQRTPNSALYEWAISKSSKSSRNLPFGRWDGTDWIDDYDSGLGRGWLKVSLIELFPTLTAYSIASGGTFFYASIKWATLLEENSLKITLNRTEDITSAFRINHATFSTTANIDCGAVGVQQLDVSGNFLSSTNSSDYTNFRCTNYVYLPY